LATSADDSVVKLWDLRKLKNFKTIPLDESEEVTKQPQNPKKQHHFYLIVYVSFWPVGHNSS
jgi:hypothetical protein